MGGITALEFLEDGLGDGAEMMLEDIRHAWKLRELQRKRKRMLQDHVEAYEREKAKFGKDGAEQLDWEQSVQRDDLNEEISELITNYLMEKAEQYQLPTPELRFDGENPPWALNHSSRRSYLNKEELTKLRSTVRKEQKESWEHWQMRLTLMIGFGGMLIGLVSMLKK